ncbi:polysaccharide deacetylase family protein [Isachenkonia alkalipeptolytica]|nr:polysaccharide deacetylase family protein [Isachenkonia alkalipeptolytica]
MRGKKVAWSLVLITILFMTVIILGDDGFGNNGDSNADSEDDVKISESAYPGIDIKAVIDESETYRMAIHYPVFEAPSLNQEIEAYVDSAKKQFFREVDKNQQHLKERPATFNVSFDIYRVSDEVYGIAFDEQSFVGGANGRQEGQIYHMNLESEEVFNPEQVIVDSQNNRKALYNYVLKEFQESEEYRDFFFKEYLQDLMLNSPDLFRKIILKDRELLLKFDKYEVTAGAAGMPEITVPLEEINLTLTETGQDFLKVDGKDESVTESDDEEKQEDQNSEVGNEEEEDKEEPLKKVALTFDDGPHSQYTPEILEILDRYDAKATFFMLGNRVEFYPDLVREVFDRGHEIGNHTYDHKDLTAMGAEAIQNEVGKASLAIEEIIGRKPKILRPPYGAFNEAVENSVQIPLILWTVDTLDWKHKDPQKILESVKSDVEEDSIILMHDIHSGTPEGLGKVLAYLDGEGYDFVTISELRNQGS